MPDGGMNIGFLDLVAVVMILLFSVRGWFRGITRELSAIIGFILGLSLAIRYAPAFEGFLRSRFPSIASFSYVLAFSLIFLSMIIALSIVGMLVNKFFKALWLGWFDRGGGFLLGLAEGVAVLSLIMWGIHLLPEVPVLKDLKRESLSYRLFEMYGLPYLRRLMVKVKWM